MKSILVVDDEDSVRISLQAIFEEEYRVIPAASGEEALRRTEEESPDLALVDLMMPGMSGLELLPRLKQLDPQLVVIVLSAVNDVPSVVRAMREGAVHYLTKPFDVSEVKLAVRMALREARKSVELSALSSEMNRWYDIGHVVGQSDTWRETLSVVERAAESSDTTVMFYGESGTGKELLARLTHNLSSRKSAPMIPIHCAAIPEALLESELFGHEKGSFTGATERRRGCVELADGGTLFLDEIGEMPTAMQSKLLRFLQDHQFMRVGGRSFIQADVRVVGATNRDLKQGVAEGWFRGDLYYRLNVVPIVIPPLRERQGDVALLVNHFLDRFRQEIGAEFSEVSTAAMELLQQYPWPGNVRELRNVMERIMVLYGGRAETIEPCHLPPEIRTPESLARRPQTRTADPEFPVSLEDEVAEVEKRLIADALRQSDDNLSKAAVLLQTTRRILKYKIDQYGMA